jgi:hypothetical protein
MELLQKNFQFFVVFTLELCSKFFNLILNFSFSFFSLLFLCKSPFILNNYIFQTFTDTLSLLSLSLPHPPPYHLFHSSTFSHFLSLSLSHPPSLPYHHLPLTYIFSPFQPFLLPSFHSTHTPSLTHSSFTHTYTHHLPCSPSHSSSLSSPSPLLSLPLTLTLSLLPPSSHTQDHLWKTCLIIAEKSCL